MKRIYYKLFKSTHVGKRVIIGKNVYIGSGCIIGYPAEHKKFWGKDTGRWVIIGDNTVITGNVTIDLGTVNDTKIGKGCFIMKGAHIGHDAVLKDNVTLSPHAVIGGHCIIGKDVNFGIGSIIHQRAEVPDGCMIGMGAVITKKTSMWKDGVFVGNPAYYLRANK
jgi:UDP-N-acetylglucosamine acyltransferase